MMGIRDSWLSGESRPDIDDPVIAAGLALLVEGEGCIQWKKGAKLEIQMTDKEPIAWAADAMNASVRKARILPSGKTVWGTYVHGSKAKRILRKIFPNLLSERRRHAARRAINRQSKRWLLGEHSPHHILTENDVIEIRKLHATGSYSYPDLAKTFGVCKQNIHQIVRRKTWKHI